MVAWVSTCSARTLDFWVGMQHCQGPGLLIKFQVSIWVLTAIVNTNIRNGNVFTKCPPGLRRSL